MNMCGNFAPLSRKKPKHYDKEYKILIPYPFKWRLKLGKVECNCKEVEEHYQPYYGFSWFHSYDCAMMKHLRKYPGIQNLVEVDECITQSD